MNAMRGRGGWVAWFMVVAVSGQRFRERCAAPGVSPTVSAHCGRIVRSTDKVTAAALEKGGWLCRALLVIQSTQSQHHADHHDAMCRWSAARGCERMPNW